MCVGVWVVCLGGWVACGVCAVCVYGVVCVWCVVWCGAFVSVVHVWRRGVVSEYE